MKNNRRILTPVTVTVIAGALVAAATLGGSLSGDAQNAKADRFTSVAQSLCSNDVWPRVSAECVAWTDGDADQSPVRFVTILSQDDGAGMTTLTRVAEAVETH